MKKILLILAVTLVFAGIASCSSGKPCIDKPNKGSLGGLFNSESDEYSPTFFDDYLYFTVTKKDSKKNEAIYKSKINNGKLSRPLIDTTLPLKDYRNSGLPVFRKLEGGGAELVFAAISKESKKVNRDLYYSKMMDNEWSKPVPLTNINGPAYESHPAFSPDGKALVFSSDRKGGYGEIDLYISERNPDGTWGEPRNLGMAINTDKEEITPFIADDGTLLFASKGYSKGDFQILRAEKVPGVWDWINPHKLKSPVNTDSSETGPAIFGDKLYLASNRKGGCGGMDLYQFPLCGPVYLDCEVVLSNDPKRSNGELIVENSQFDIIERIKLEESGTHRFKLQAMDNYTVLFKDECGIVRNSQKIFAPCSDSTTIVMHTLMDLNLKDEYELNEIKVPFFTTGYYLPNTSANLAALRLKFSYNIFGIDESTKYIENPDEKYDEFAREVESSLDSAADFIFRTVTDYKGDCNGKTGKISIVISGFADPRPISQNAKFMDSDIEDADFDFFVPRGSKMDNDLLSKLRAYFTAKHFEKKLKSRDEYNNIIEKVEWRIEGKGVDKSETGTLEQKRRVNIKINFDD